MVVIALAFSSLAIPFVYSTTFMTKGIFAFIMSIGNSWIDIGVNVCVIELFKKRRLDIWLQIAHGGFGVGGLLSPYIVYVF